MIVLLSYGNSDDKLSQRQWALMQIAVKSAIHAADARVYGEWHAHPDSIFQNAAVCFHIDDNNVPELQGVVRALAIEFKQDAIAWNAVTETLFLGPADRKGYPPEHDHWTSQGDS